MKLRRDEDRVAAAALGCRIEHLDHLDAIYRSDVEGHPAYVTPESVFPTPAPFSESELVHKIVDDLLRVACDYDVTVLVAPMGVGRHLDHRIVREAASRAAEMQRCDLLFYEDLPYSGAEPGAVWLDGITEGLLPLAITLRPNEWSRKAVACGAYRSQLLALWPGGPDQMLLELRGRAPDGRAREWFWGTQQALWCLT